VYISTDTRWADSSASMVANKPAPVVLSRLRTLQESCLGASSGLCSVTEILQHFAALTRDCI